MTNDAIRAALALIPSCQHCWVLWDYAEHDDRQPREEARKQRCKACWDRAEAAVRE